MQSLLESWNRFMLQEASIRQVMDRFNNPKFVKKSEFSQIDPRKAKEEIEKTVPDGFDVQQKANYLDWRISIFLKTGVYEGPDSSVVKKYYDAKEDEGNKKIISKINISDIKSIEEFEEIVNNAEEALGHKEKKKKEESTSGEGQKLVYEDENWSVYLPETKGASVALCDGPDPRPVKQGGTRAKWCTGTLRRKYYEQYHTQDNPRIIFISKSNPADKYQFNYFGIPLWGNKPEFKNAFEKDIYGTDVFYELNSIVIELSDKLPERVVKKAESFKGKQNEL